MDDAKFFQQVENAPLFCMVLQELGVYVLFATQNRIKEV